MSKLMLVTLPVNHPRRLALVNALAAYGDQYRKEHGVWPAWMSEFVGISSHVLDGNQFTRAVGLGQLAPQGTAGGLFDQLNYGNSVPEKLAGLLNPPVATVVNTGIQQIKNESSDYPTDIGRFALNQALYSVPGMSKFFPASGMAPDSLPWDPRQRTYTWKDYTGRSHKIPWDQRPGARPVSGPLGIASRVLGLTLYDTPTKGRINSRAVKKQIQTSKKAAKS